ncbi:DUF58 domain-containing protein [Terrimesophilobacter mesophilus]|uniref:DUF58 domain-containing protein n=2 Tax=Terrimesophilobacter mesophilus TaxID=433647 RepID=A0A4R8VGB3_9MICO|nr:DUF58 domain-containing protein [Terrimesophilobacter mesophilus]
MADAIVSVVRVSRDMGGVLRAWLSKVSSVVTPLGWAMLAIVPLAFALGYSLGWMELVVVAWAGLVLLIVASVYLVGRSSFTVSLGTAHSRVLVGEPASGSVTIANPTRHRILGATVEVPVGSALAAVAMPSLARGAEFSHEFAVPTGRRGVIQIGPVRTIRADPIGLVRREIIWTESQDLYIHPRTIGVPSTTTGFIRDLEGNPTRQISNSDVSFHALREYVPGDERRYIHWKSTARTGRYMVRQFEETRRSHLVIALSLASSDYAHEDEFELAVSVAGSLGVRAIKDARAVSVVVSEKTPDFAKRKVFAVSQLSTLTRSRLLDDLSLIDLDESALNVRDVARVVSEQVAGISVAFLVCGSKTTPNELRAASASFPVDVEVVAIVCDPEVVPGLRRVAGLSVLSIGYLQDLQKSLARSAAA